MNHTLNKTKEYIIDFNRLTEQHGGPISYSLRFKGTTNEAPHILFSACVHGNEVGSLPALFRLIENIQAGKINYPGTITISLGNVEAMKAGKRYVDVDMNRHFGDGAENPAEAQRANDVCRLIDDCDIFIDLHQTIQPTHSPFVVMGDTIENRHWAQALGSPTKVILRDLKKNTYLTASIYATMKGKIATTIELSQVGYNDFATQLANYVIDRTLEIGTDLSKNVSLESLAKQSDEPTWLDITHYQTFDGPKCKLQEGWQNLSPVKKGQSLGYKDDGSEFTSPLEGFVVFPKYVERDSEGKALNKPPKDIIGIATKV